MARSNLALAGVLLVVFGLLVVGGCTPAPTPAAVVVAPIPKTYTCEQSHKAAAEHLALPPDSAIAILLDDYRVERKELRRLHGIAEPAPCPRAPQA